MTQKHVHVPGRISRSSWLQILSLLVRCPEPHRGAAFPAVTVPSGGGGAWGSGHRHLAVTQMHTEHGSERARAKKILVWTQITSHFTSWRKASALEADIIYNAQSFQMPTQSRGPPRSTNSSMNYVQNLQGSLHHSLHSITKCTLLFTCLLSENGDSFVCPPHPSNCWLNHHEQMLAHAFCFPLG